MRSHVHYPWQFSWFFLCFKEIEGLFIQMRRKASFLVSCPVRNCRKLILSKFFTPSFDQGGPSVLPKCTNTWPWQKNFECIWSHGPNMAVRLSHRFWHFWWHQAHKGFVWVRGEFPQRGAKERVGHIWWVGPFL